jgi:ubiquinone/menaquinone biosynthesis C-methylase UbiE
MDAENLTFSDNEFDVVSGRGILHHLDLNKCFSEISRASSSGRQSNLYGTVGTQPSDQPLSKDDSPVSRGR